MRPTPITLIIKTDSTKEEDQKEKNDNKTKTETPFQKALVAAIPILIGALLPLIGVYLTNKNDADEKYKEAQLAVEQRRNSNRLNTIAELYYFYDRLETEPKEYLKRTEFLKDLSNLSHLVLTNLPDSIAKHFLDVRFLAKITVQMSTEYDYSYRDLAKIKFPTLVDSINLRAAEINFNVAIKSLTSGATEYEQKLDTYVIKSMPK